jgi:hypothetical protein
VTEEGALVAQAGADYITGAFASTAPLLKIAAQPGTARRI